MKSRVKKTVGIFIVFLFFIGGVCAQSAPTTPDTTSYKIGLALSGGGAKGFAHLGLLHLIDSLQIKIDYITGTSMGAIMGGLYAMGYTAKEIKEIVTKTDWDKVLSDKAPLNKINMEEKSEYNQYALELPFYGFLPGLPISLIEGQYIAETFNEYTYPARCINDFSKLPIPTAIVTSDIVNGEKVLQEKGSLSLAMSATSAIPGAFAPVYIDNKLLIDGGLSKNFPVQEVLDMGANFVIAGYTGFRMLKERDLANPVKLISQTFAVTSARNSEKEKEKANIYVDFNAALANYNVSDFNNCAKIIEAGEKESRIILPQLLKIAEMQRARNVQYKRIRVEDTQTPIVAYNFVSNRGKQIVKKKELQTLKKLLQLEENEYYSAKEVNDALERLYGTRIYRKVFNTFTHTPKGLEMNIHLKKGYMGFLKTALHYDSDQRAGILLNYTFYNAFDYHSKIIATVDLSERFKARFKYAFIIDSKNRIWFNMGTEYQSLKNDDLVLSSIYARSVSKQATDFYKRVANAYVGLSYGMLKNMSVEAGVAYEYGDIARITSRIKHLDDENLFTQKRGRQAFYKHSDFSGYFRIKQNSMSDSYYAPKGNRFVAEVKYVFANKVRVMDTAKIDPLENVIIDYVNPAASEDASSLNGFLRIYANEEYALKLSRRFSLKLNAFGGLAFSQKGVVSIGSYMPFNNKFTAGGFQRKHFNENPEFAGFKEGALPLNSLIAMSLGVQYNPFKKLYITPMASFGFTNDNLSKFKDVLNDDNALIGIGLNIGYMSFLGPINVNLYSGSFGTIANNRYAVSIGFKF